MGRGHKTCPDCGTTTGPRSFKCPNKKCGHSFEINKKPEFLKQEKGDHKFNWKELQRGDRIKVLTGSGSYWPTETEKVNMGYYGKFVVKYIDKNGIHATGNKKEGPMSHCYIWMGAEVVTPSGLVRAPHRVVKLKAR